MRVLVVGTPRSGTTWVGSVLGKTAGAGYVHEPDEVEKQPYAMKALRGLARLPVLAADDRAPAAYSRLWDAAFGAPVRFVPGQQRIAHALYERTPDSERIAALDTTDPHETLRTRVVEGLAIPLHPERRVEHPVVKSVRLSYALEWVAARWGPSVVVCRRHPLDVIASALDLGWDVRPEMATRFARYDIPLPDQDNVAACTAWWVGLQMSALDDAVRAHPEYHTVDHAELCSDPLGSFRRLAASVGLVWTSGVEEYIVATDRPGSGYAVNRVASEQNGRWRERLSVADARAAVRVLRQFPIGERYPVDETNIGE